MSLKLPCSEAFKPKNAKVANVGFQVICDSSLLLPKLGSKIVEYPRFIFDDEATTRCDGRWIDVLIDYEHVVTLFVRNISDLMLFSQKLCTVCAFPVEQCVCGHKSLPPDRCWTVFSEKTGKRVVTDRELNVATVGRNGFVHLELDFFQLQSGVKSVLRFVPSKYFVPTIDNEQVMKWLEDFGTLFLQLRKSRSVSEVLLALGACIRSVSGKACSSLLLNSYLCEIDFSQVFRLQSSRDWIDAVEEVFQNYKTTTQSKLVGLVRKVLNHVVLRSMFQHMNVEVAESLYGPLGEKARITTQKCVSFGEACLELIIFSLKKARQYVATGDMSCFIFDEDSLGKLYERGKNLKNNFEFLGNPGAVGISIHQFVSDLDNIINDIKSARKAFSNGSMDDKSLSVLLADMQLIKNRYLIQMASSQIRKQPLGIVLHGSPGIGKSDLCKMLATFDAKLHNRPEGPEFVSFISSDSDHFDTYKSWQHTVVLDDVAQHVPNKVDGIDKSVAYMMKIANNQPWCPPKADLEDKGKTPMLCDLLIVTTNKADMNLRLYFESTMAVMRRLPFVVTVEVKDEYKNQTTGGIDGAKVPRVQFPDVWNFRIRRAVRANEGPDLSGNYGGKYEDHLYFTDIHAFLAWFKEFSLSHNLQQEKFVERCNKLQSYDLCRCDMPVELCCCQELQSGRSNVPVSVELTPWRRRGEEYVGRGPQQGVERRVWTSPFSLRNWINEERHPLAEEYAFEHLNKLRSIGWTEEQIREDFQDYLNFHSINWSNHLASLAGLTSIYCFGYTGLGLFCMLFFFKNSLSNFVERQGIRLARTKRWTSYTGKWIMHQRGCVPTSALAVAITALLLLRCYNKVQTLHLQGSSSSTSVGSGCESVDEGSSTAPVQPESDLKKSINEIGTIPTPKDETERTNPWVVRENQLISCNFQPGRIIQEDSFERRVFQNTLKYEVLVPGSLEADTGNLFVIDGTTLLTNNHIIPDVDFKMTIHFAQDGAGLRPSIVLHIKQSQLVRKRERDIVFIRTRGLPQIFKDLRANFSKIDLCGRFQGYYIVNGPNNRMKKIELAGVHNDSFQGQVGNRDFRIEKRWVASAAEPTISGDCGGVMVVLTPHGPLICGIHFMATRSNVFSTSVTIEDLPVKETMVQGGTINVLEKDLSFSSRISYTDFHTSGNLMYHGELLGFRSRPSHSVHDSELAEQIYGRKLFGRVVERKLFPPVMDSWRAQQLALSEFVATCDYIDEPLVERCCNAFFEHLVSNLPEGELDLISVVNIDVAVNGMPGVEYLTGINRSTSMGYPFNTQKTKYLVDYKTDLWPDGKKFVKEIVDLIDADFQKYKNGVRCHPIYKAHLKDEPVSQKKQLSGKTRVFFACPVSPLILFRMFFMNFTRVVSRNRILFRCAVGLNPMSHEWDELVRHMIRHGDRNIAGDFRFYDKKMKLLLLRHVCHMILRLCKCSKNVTAEQLVAMEAMLEDLCHPTADFFGCLITLLGGEVSGHSVTTVLNCLINIIYQMYSFSQDYVTEDYFEKVNSVVLGDDNWMNVSEKAPKFTHTRMQEVMDSIGVGYTMADKEQASVPYIPLSEVTFLKRSVVFSQEIGQYVAPLDVESIFKMLVIQTGKESMAPIALGGAIQSAKLEAFLHGRTRYEELDEFLSSLEMSFQLKVELESYESKSFDKRLEEYDDGRPKDTGLGQFQSQKSLLVDSYCPDADKEELQSGRVDSPVFHARAFPEIGFYQSVELDTNFFLKTSCDETITAYQNHSLANSKISNVQLGETHNGIIDDEKSASVEQQQTSFLNETEPIVLDMSVPHDVVGSTQAVSAHLGEYLSRPAKIFSYTWVENESTVLKTSFTPWSLFFNLTSIKNKLESFGLIRCNLKLKFTINASQFYYGSMKAVYTPLHTSISDTIGTSDDNGVQMLYSQRPGVWLDPQSTSTVEMTLPFLYNQSWLRTTSLAGLANFGKVNLVQYANLRSANGVTTAGVSIVVYAWAEDVELTAPTSQAVLQGGKKSEYTGMISGPASTVASIASRLKDVPVVGPFMKATEVVSSSIGDVASFFGFTNVPNVADVQPFKNLPFHAMSSSAISEPVAKLSLQPKQEVAISTTELGDPTKDQLHIAEFCSRESFLCGALWQTTDAEDKILFTSAVTPELYRKTAGTNFKLYNTPMALVMRLFRWWRGDIIFRFKLVRTQYHRGRLNICWDTTMSAAAGMPGFGNPSVMNIVMDLEECDEVEVRVPFMQALPFLMKNDESANAGGQYWSNGSSPTFTASCNGMIQARVVNRLTAPEATSDVDLLVFVRCADNFEVAGPSQNFSTWTQYALQSGKKTVFDKPSVSDPRAYDEVFGEKIVSLRELLHRQSKAWTQVVPKTADYAGVQQTFSVPFQRLPREYGYSSNGWELAKGTLVPASDFPFNFVRVHPLSLLANCFLGYKGSTNYNFNVVNNVGKTTNPVQSVSVCRVDNIDTAITPSAYSTGVSNSTSQFARNLNVANTSDLSGATGMALTNQVTQAGLSVNLPYYSNYKFFFNNVDNSYSSTVNGDGKTRDWFQLIVRRGITNNSADSDLLIDVYVGTGPDFNLIFFLNCPVLTFLNVPTAATTG
nr:MAG: hypothetical protein [Marnaviridae sp.]